MTSAPHDRNETAITDALARLRKGIDVPAIDPAREAALLAAFDAHRAPATRRLGFPSFQWMAAAATLVVVTVSLNWMIATRLRSNGLSAAKPADLAAAGEPDAPADLAGFVAWPGASAWPPFESGSIVRVDLPVSLLPTLGLSVPSSATVVVAADIVVGQDGFARAVRLVQKQ